MKHGFVKVHMPETELISVAKPTLYHVATKVSSMSKIVKVWYYLYQQMVTITTKIRG